MNNNQREEDALLGISPAQRRVFDAVSELQDACGVVESENNGWSNQRATLRRMLVASILSVYGSTWVTDTERSAAAAAALAVLQAFEQSKERAYAEMQHAAHGPAEDPDGCEICARRADTEPHE